MSTEKLHSRHTRAGQPGVKRRFRAHVFCSFALLPMAATTTTLCQSGGATIGDGGVPPAIQQAFTALVIEIASCGEAAVACFIQAGSNSGALNKCGVELNACAAAGTTAATTLAEAVSACVAEACPDSGTNLCSSGLETCLGLSGVAVSDAGCLGKLQTCVVSRGGTINACTEEVRQCVKKVLPPPSKLTTDPAAAFACLQALEACLNVGTSPDTCIRETSTCLSTP
jgi:hypothetical protein